ncbi:alpha-mannosidase [Neosynechococcus sphagnicola]|uniref:alpha-mannosidase n=1 Tax=Neosynechococcus sphagnicola TaxID=1501145 RepID=UPI000AF9BF0B|nr:alpha-mannosidase [Neosynechococcus sphagnicola]
MRTQLCFESTNPAFPEPGFIADELTVLQGYLTRFEPEKLPDLEAAIAPIHWELRGDRPAFDQELAQLRTRLQPLTVGLQQRRLQLLGHAHLDLAWLWPVSETWEAAERTFESALGLQQDFPDLIFGHSTPALYDWIETHRPQLFRTIQAQVAAGRWEILGGLWVEPELNLIDGESLVRQVLYGQHYCLEKFGALNAIAWVPDSFGFCWQLPQILKQGGIEFFVTQKLRWNDTTQFPHAAFWWRSPDGTEIFSLMSALIGQDIDPIKMANYAWEWETQTGLSNPLWLPGVGDHGGGPTRDMLETAQRWQLSSCFPTLSFTTASDYLQSLRQSATDFPVWDDELYLEFHRGCYTTHADQKRWNRHCEGLLYQAELFASLASWLTGADYPKTALEKAWKQMLFNQFHDILPGSSIPQVFEETNQTWQQIHQVGSAILEASFGAIAAEIDVSNLPHADAQPVVVFNSLNWERTAVVAMPLPNAASSWQIYDPAGQLVPCQRTADHLLFLAQGVPGAGYQSYWLCPTATNAPTPAPPSGFTLENDWLRVIIDPQTGEISSLWDHRVQREILRDHGNQLQAFQDQGQYWDAWNIDPNYAQHPLPPPQLQAIRWLESGSLQQRLQVVRQLGQSTFWQDYILETGSGVLQIQTTVDWQEQHVLVKAAFPLAMAADSITYETPCGAIQRPTRPSAPREAAQWEVPALRWADLGTSDYGISLLNNAKYGYDSQSDQLRLTLLRSPTWPDPEADQGLHQFTYALYPHTGSWQRAQTVQRGYELNQPLQVRAYPVREASATGQLPCRSQLLHLQAENLVLIACKQAEANPQQWIVRCYETQGAMAQFQMESDLPLEIIQAVDLLERPPQEAWQPRQSDVIQPWQIRSFQIQCRSNAPQAISTNL